MMVAAPPRLPLWKPARTSPVRAAVTRVHKEGGAGDLEVRGLVEEAHRGH